VNTSIAITAIIAALLLASTVVTAVRDVVKAKHQAAPCKHCTCDKNKENEA
jgi:hypothetical protein